MSNLNGSGRLGRKGRAAGVALGWMLAGAAVVALAPATVTAQAPPGRWAEPPPPRQIPVTVAPSNTARQNPYETPGIVVAGGGIGGLMLRAAGETSVTSSYLLHLGVAMGSAEFALRANLAPKALTWSDPQGREVEVGIYATRASFEYRFLPDSVVHPVAGLGLEMIVASPAAGPDGLAFAAAGRLGLELAYPLASGALALGIDTTGHLPFAATADCRTDLALLLGFGAYLDYRF